MSTSFEIFPTQKKIPLFENIINDAKLMFDDFLKKYNIKININIEINEIKKTQRNVAPKKIVAEEETYNIIMVNNIGYILVFFNELTDFDIEIWNDEIETNIKAKKIVNSIQSNIKVGYTWQVKRTIGQPAIIGLFYGFIAMAIAKETDGYIYSDDGAWCYESFPLNWKQLFSEYNNFNNINNKCIKHTFEQWIKLLENGI